MKKMKTEKGFWTALLLVLSVSLVFANGTKEPAASSGSVAKPEKAAVVTELPRNQTLYFNGQQWGAVVDQNPLSTNSNCWYQAQNTLSRELVWETLYMYNPLDGKLYPLLADGDYKVDGKTYTVKIKKAAHWSDGTPLTANDVEYTFAVHKKYQTPMGIDAWLYLDSVKAVDDYTIRFTAKASNYNPLKILDMFERFYIIPEHAYKLVEQHNNEDPTAVKTDKWPECIGSGPYKPYLENAQKSVLIRDDNYWGKDSSMWGRLPAPKYIAHNIFSDNNAGAVAFQSGEVDVAQQFMSEVWKMWEAGAPVSTYLDQPPYYLDISLPTAWFNTARPGLDQAAVRKAIAISVDYDQIKTTAMSNYTPSMRDVPPCLMNPTAPERALIDESQLKPYQWVGKQYDDAKKMLDDAGIVDTDGDGYREYNGKKLSFKVECPTGWTDWEASLQIVAQAGQAIGLDITTYFPQFSVMWEDIQTGNYDIIMWTNDGTGISNPWWRCYQSMYSNHGQYRTAERVPSDWSRYSNEEADKILEQIPTTTDKTDLKKLYTRLNVIYLRDVPGFALMYRPQLFHTVNESVWTNFPAADDGTNIPPLDCTDGYGVASLYHISLINK
jgi:peptide/nickel transport system substrate-binding protein